VSRTYSDFIASKRIDSKSYGFSVEESQLNPSLFDWQKRVVAWALQRGRAALFCDTGLGKTFQQLVFSEQVVKYTGGRVLIHAPVGVRQQTQREAEKFGINCEVAVCDEMSDVPATGIAIINYEKIHKFDTRHFVGVVLDESSILKSFTGKIKRSLCDQWGHADFRLACTATPSPNDHMELGNHAQFLDVMASNEMLSRWFYNDTMQAGGYKILPHGERDFWGWVASWAACVSMPSDIGGSDDGYVLPELVRDDHIVVPDDEEPEEGCLFFVGGGELTATTVHREKRKTTNKRAAKVAEIVNNEPQESWLVWCDTNYEANELLSVIEGAVDLRGSESVESKERKLSGFVNGDIRVLITKPTIAGFGLNFQHCARMAFIGLSYSYEQYYQAVRRCWRFGQTRPVHAHVVMAESELAILNTNARKQGQHAQMQSGMRNAINDQHELATKKDLSLASFQSTRKAVLPWAS
jgi:hypothetical protein